jgi:guanylate kinase
MAQHERRQSNLFVFDGPSGHGKSESLKILDRYSVEFDVRVLRKVSTREVRPEEVGRDCLDTVFVSQEEFARRCRKPSFWTYFNGPAQYGFDVQELRVLCAAHANVACILTDASVIRRLQRECPEINVIPIFVFAGSDQIAAGRIEGQASDVATVKRLARSARVIGEHRRDPLLFRHCLLNIYDKPTLEEHLLQLLKSYQPSPVQGSRS